MLETLYLQSVISEIQRMNEEHVLKLKTIQAIRKAIESRHASQAAKAWDYELWESKRELEAYNEGVAAKEMKRIRAERAQRGMFVSRKF
jgi:hypothetical protein